MVAVLSPEELESIVRRAVREELASGGIGNSGVLSTAQAAQVAGVRPKTVREWISSGVLPAGRRGRKRSVLRIDLERYLAGDAPQKANSEGLAASLRKRSA